MNPKHSIKFITGIALLLFVMCTNKFVSRNVPPPPPPSDDTHECIYDGKLNSTERLKFFPFNQAKKIIIASFPVAMLKLNDSTYTYAGAIPKQNDQIDFSVFKEMITLNQSQIVTLTDILYNNRDPSKYKFEFEYSCDLPIENAIIFFNKSDQYFAYMELSFTCNAFHVIPDTFNYGERCEDKIQLLKQFLKNNGIQNGFRHRKL